MERSPYTISTHKFAKLPLARRHELLAEMALLCANQKEPHDYLASFWQRYETLVLAAQLDRYLPPPWLSPLEGLEEVSHFHLLLAGVEASVGVSPEPVCSWQARFQMTVVLDQVRSPYNLGSLLRLIDNFGFKDLVHASPLFPYNHPRLCRAARGCQNWIPVTQVEDLDQWLTSQSLPIIAIEDGPQAVALADWEPPESALFLLGNETYGIAEALRSRCTQMVKIPMYGFKKSMNVSHAFAVIAQRIVEKLGPSCS